MCVQTLPVTALQVWEVLFFEQAAYQDFLNQGYNA
jgi:hypothetical protein